MYVERPHSYQFAMPQVVAHLRVVQLKLDEKIDANLLHVEYMDMAGQWIDTGQSTIDWATVEELDSKIEAGNASMAEGECLGAHLHKALIAPSSSTGIIWRHEKQAAEAEQEDLRLALSVSSRHLAGQLNPVRRPWDALYDPADSHYVASDYGLLYCLRLGRRRDIAAKPHLRVMIAHTNPADANRPVDHDIPPMDALDITPLKRTLDDLHEQTGGKCEWIHVDARLDRIREHLEHFQPDVLHFVGHSILRNRLNPHPVLIFVNRDDNATRVTATRLAYCFAEAKWTPRLVVLTSCRSSEFALELLRQQGGVVLGCRYDTGHQQATKLERTLYRSLANGKAIDQALADGRRRVMDSLQAPNPADWIGPFAATSENAAAPLVLYDPGEAGRQWEAIEHMLHCREVLQGMRERGMYLRGREEEKLQGMRERGMYLRGWEEEKLQELEACEFRAESDHGSAGVINQLEFSAFHPREVLPGETHQLLAYAHTSEMQSEVILQATEELGAAVTGGHDHADKAVTREAELLVVPYAEGLSFRPRGQHIGLWEDMQKVEFHFRALDQYAGRACSGGVLFVLDGLIIGQVPLGVLVRASEDDDFTKELQRVQAQAYSDIFVSYSHRDTRAVERIEHYARSLGNQFIRDQQHLRGGEAWAPRLLEMIDEADVFQLFWSPAAADSCYVEKEWRHALKHQKQSSTFVRPVYWRKRFLWFPHAPYPDPPPDLAGIQFTYVPL